VCLLRYRRNEGSLGPCIYTCRSIIPSSSQGISSSVNDTVKLIRLTFIYSNASRKVPNASPRSRQTRPRGPHHGPLTQLTNTRGCNNIETRQTKPEDRLRLRSQRRRWNLRGRVLDRRPCVFTPATQETQGSGPYSWNTRGRKAVLCLHYLLGLQEATRGRWGRSALSKMQRAMRR
jgi:hypothetical protein